MAQVKIARAVATTLLAGALAGAPDVVTSLAAAAPASPTGDELERARHVEDDAVAEVAHAEGRLAAATARFDELMLAAARAAEAHNGAQYALKRARGAESSAVAEAARSNTAAAEARSQLGRVAASAYRTGGQLRLLAALIETDRPDRFVDGTAVMQTVARSQGTIADLAAETAARAQDAAERAHRARLDREAAARAADAASERAADAVAAFENQVAALEQEREAALAELAEARGTTVALEEQRQAELAMAAAQAEQAATPASPGPDEAAAAAASVAEPPASDAADAADTDVASSSAAPASVATSPPGPSPAHSSPAATSRPPSRTAQPSPTDPPETSASSNPPPATSPPPPASGTQRVVDYARAQLGKPYEWGAAGPDSFDCSGLTMRAWQQAGVSLPHWSVAQARMVTRVSYADLRPGDLVLWSDNGNASGTYHMGLYIGAGQMIHAPRPGKVVEVQNVFYWRTPSFYGRV